MYVYSVILSFILGIVIGILLVPLVIYFRARKGAWDDSNFFNVLHVICHLALHPSDFTKMRYSDGKNPFWYLTEDEYSEVLKTRPN